MADKRSHGRVWTGALLSAFVLPGLGQLHHGDRVRGIALMIPAICCIVILCMRIFKTVWSLMQSHGSPSLSPDYIRMITELVHRQEGLFFTRIILVFLVIWAIGVVDALIRAPRRNLVSPHEPGH